MLSCQGEGLASGNKTSKSQRGSRALLRALCVKVRLPVRAPVWAVCGARTPPKSSTQPLRASPGRKPTLPVMECCASAATKGLGAVCVRRCRQSGPVAQNARPPPSSSLPNVALSVESWCAAEGARGSACTNVQHRGVGRRGRKGDAQARTRARTGPVRQRGLCLLQPHRCRWEGVGKRARPPWARCCARKCVVRVRALQTRACL